MSILRPAALALAAMLAAHTASAERPTIFVKPPAGIQGTATAEGFKGWTEADSSAFAVSNTYRVGGATGAGSSSTVPTFSELTWLQRWDGTVPLLTREASIGKPGTVELALARVQSKTNGTTPLRLKLENTLLTGVQASAWESGGSASVSARFGKISLEHRTLDELGQEQRPITSSYDLATRKLESPDPSTAPHGTGGKADGHDALMLRLGQGSTAVYGGSTRAGYENWIRLDSIQWGVSRTVDGATGKDVAVSRPMFEALTWTQSLDRSLPYLFASVAGGTALPTATIELVQDHFLTRIVLDGPVVTGLSVSGSSGSESSMATSVAFARMSQTTWAVGDDGKLGKPTSFGWDVTTGKVFTPGSPLKAGNFGEGFFGAAAAAAGGAAPLPEAPAPLPVPEPSQWAMLLAGLALVGWASGQRRAAAG